MVLVFFGPVLRLLHKLEDKISTVIAGGVNARRFQLLERRQRIYAAIRAADEARNAGMMTLREVQRLERTLDRMHFVVGEIDRWLAANPGVGR